VRAANGRNLSDVVTAVGEMETAPLIDGEGTESKVREATLTNEAVLGLLDDGIEAGDGLRHRLDELLS
jgi:hypothetical protein